MLSIYQGNDKVFKFTRLDTEKNSIITEPKQIWFTIKKSYENLGFVIQKSLNQGISQNDDGSWSIYIDAEDTATLEPGKYVCDVKIVNEFGAEYHIIKPQDFVIMPVATQNRGG